MATVERRPLPPPGYPATTITEADRAEIMGQANDVIDHYLNGSGSFTVDGIRKPLSDEAGHDSTVQDLNNFKNSIINAQQFADDRSHILNSVVELINRTIHQLQHAAVAGNVGVTDNNTLPAPATPDSINSAHVPIPLGPTDPSRSAPGGEIISPFGTNERFSPGSATPSQTLYETRSFPVPSTANPGGGVDPARSSSAANPSGSFSDRFGTWGSSQAPVAPPNVLGSSGSFSDRFGNWSSAPPDNFDNPGSPLLSELMRRRSAAAPAAPAQSTTAFEMPGSTLGRHFVEAAHRAANGLLSSAEAALLPSDPTGAPVVPYVSPGASIAPGRLDTLNDRFGNWSSPQANPGQNDAQKMRVLRSYMVRPDGSRLALPGPEHAPQPQDQPMTGYGLPSIFGLPDQSPSGDDMDDWLARWIPFLRQ